MQITLHQGAIEQIFLDSMAQQGLRVDRETVPISIKLSADEAELKDPQAYAVTVSYAYKRWRGRCAEGRCDRSCCSTLMPSRARILRSFERSMCWVLTVRLREFFGLEGVLISSCRCTFLRLFTVLTPGADFVWGVVDVIPDTDFPDIRNRCAIHSHNGSCMVVPREGDKVRLYVQIAGATEAVDPATGRVDRSRIGPQDLMQIAKKTFYPYKIDADRIERVQLGSAWRRSFRCRSGSSLQEMHATPTLQRPARA